MSALLASRCPHCGMRLLEIVFNKHYLTVCDNIACDLWRERQDIRPQNAPLAAELTAAQAMRSTAPKKKGRPKKARTEDGEIMSEETVPSLPLDNPQPPLKKKKKKRTIKEGNRRGYTKRLQKKVTKGYNQ